MYLLWFTIIIAIVIVIVIYHTNAVLFILRLYRTCTSVFCLRNDRHFLSRYLFVYAALLVKLSRSTGVICITLRFRGDFNYELAPCLGWVLTFYGTAAARKWKSLHLDEGRCDVQITKRTTGEIKIINRQTQTNSYKKFYCPNLFRIRSRCNK